ncbi:hypothetical protein O9992_02180 [Vibrio lentus]|nr:hypothetical protein [Vibrio lentus]
MSEKDLLRRRILRAKLQQNLDLYGAFVRIDWRATSSRFVDSLVGFAQAHRNGDDAIPLFKSMLAASDDTIVSAGIWPEPYVLDSKKAA